MGQAPAVRRLLLAAGAQARRQRRRQQQGNDTLFHASSPLSYPLPLAEGHTRGPEPVFPSTTCNEALLCFHKLYLSYLSFLSEEGFILSQLPLQYL